MSTFGKGVEEIFTGDMSSATDALGFTDHETEASTMEMAKSEAEASRALTREQLDFQKEQYDEWNSIYGDLQEDIGTYMKNLTGDSEAAKQIEAIQREGQLAQQQTGEALAQRGLTGSGIEAQMLQQQQFGTAMAKAGARSSAEDLANQKKMQFLQLGLSQGTAISGQMAATSATGVKAASGISQTALSSSVGLTSTGLQVTGSKSEEMGESITGMFSGPMSSKMGGSAGSAAG